MTPSADPAQVGRARKGDAAAFEALVAPRVGPMTRTAMAVLGQEGEATDATRDALVIAWREMASLRDSAALDAWLTRILVNRCRRGRRGAGGGRSHELPPAPADRPGTPGHLARAFDRLTLDERTILVLRYLDGLPPAVIASVLRIADEKAETRLAAARTSLDRALAWEIRLVPPGPVSPAGSDAALEATLRARAGLLDPGAASRVLAMVHEEMRAHRPGGLVGLLPFGERAGSWGGRAGWGAAIAAAVLVTVVLGGRQIGSATASPRPPASPMPATPSASPDGTALPDACASPAVTGRAPSTSGSPASGSPATPTGIALPASSCGPGG